MEKLLLFFADGSNVVGQCLLVFGIVVLMCWLYEQKAETCVHPIFGVRMVKKWKLIISVLGGFFASFLLLINFWLLIATLLLSVLVLGLDRNDLDEVMGKSFVFMFLFLWLFYLCGITVTSLEHVATGTVCLVVLGVAETWRRLKKLI